MHGHLNVKMDAESLMAAKYVPEVQYIRSNKKQRKYIYI